MTRSLLVIMPSEAFPGTVVKRQIVQDVCRNMGWTLVMPEYDRLRPEFDLSKTRLIIGNVNIVLVDLSYERPSCYYELGLAEALGARVVCVAATGTEIHQTANRGSVISFSNMSDFAGILRAALGRE